jgi:hypothetical protein
MIPTEVGPVVDAQLVAAPVPERAKFITPAGATALATPVTVAVKITCPPRVGVLVEEIPTVGVASETVVVVVEATADTAL